MGYGVNSERADSSEPARVVASVAQLEALKSLESAGLVNRRSWVRVPPGVPHTPRNIESRKR